MKIMALFFTLILFFNLYGQTKIVFNLDIQTLIDEGLFFPEKKERLFVRGNFNSWEGFDFELVKLTDNNIYTGRYNVDVNIGDTLEYKYIIKRKNNKIYWERNPNPLNSNNGNRKLVINKNSITLPAEVFQYDEYIIYPVLFSKEKLREDFMQMRNTVEEIHPALYDYTNKKTLDSLFNSYLEQLNNDLEFEEVYKIFSSVLEPIGCGHTKLWIPSDYWNAAPQRFFPLKLLFPDKNVYVRSSYIVQDEIPVGSKILSINDISINEIINELKSLHSSDGFIDAFKSKSVEKNFSSKYALSFGYPKVFALKYIPPGENNIVNIQLLPINSESVNLNPFRGDELSLKIISDNKIAVLTINTFIYYDHLEMFKSFIDSSFEVIKNKKINNLIIDLRGNDGGDPYCSSYLLSYIEKEPVPYFAESYNHYETLAQNIPLAENNLKGSIITLIDGSCFSTTGHFCALLKYHRTGKLVGTETGATYICTGSVHYVDLKNTKLILGTARKQRYSAAVKDMVKTRGVMPDYFVEQSQDDLINNKDTVLDFAYNLISTNRRGE